MCFGSKKTSVAAKTDEFYSAGKKDYGDLPSLAVGDKTERTEDGMADLPDPNRNKRSKANKERMVRGLAKQTTNKDLARSLLMPYNK
tara:strand:- start:146 stop:406 length:261 start_codon:yes stop_codon:yes gene_type:complete